MRDDLEILIRGHESPSRFKRLTLQFSRADMSIDSQENFYLQWDQNVDVYSDQV